ncbi:DUF6191 domain-containing protein [Catenulispora rubra]|uniref:DUF6191 domain-containing protein n=1 Tax=Catenulispora rubra TaxID=280293 RepID=UPI0018927CCB|nr:DUF6191 domain-containing protein [Catenulispora rubra]
MSVFFDMFVPSRRHVEDERNRLEWTREEEGEGDPHRGPIDLDGGVVSIKMPGAESQVTRPAAKGTRHSEP